MKENRRNTIVGIFVIAGLVIVGWMVFQFGDLPAFVSRYDACEVAIFFPEAPGIQENTVILFRGYRVGKVIQVDPPRLLDDLDNPDRQFYQIKVIAAISKDYRIPANVVPKIHRRGLGGSSVELVLTESATLQMLSSGAKLKGVVSETSEFITEKTQQQLDQLIGSLTGLSNQLQRQLIPLPPEVVDQGDSDEVHANITTAVIRLDRTLKHLDIFLGDVENQQNFKQGLADFAALSKDIRSAITKIEHTTVEARKLIEQVSGTVGNIDDLAGRVTTTFERTSVNIQNTADQLATTLKHLDVILIKISAGKGTIGQAFNDPRLYEALTDACTSLTLAVEKLQSLLTEVEEKGLKKVWSK